MNPFFLYLLKAMACSGVLYGYYHFALRNRVFHHWNRFYLLAAVLLSLLFPLVPLPQWYTSSGVADAIKPYEIFYTSGSEITVISESSAVDWQRLLWIFYGVVATAFLLHTIQSLLRIRKLLREGEQKPLGNILFVTTEHPNAPFAFFKWLFWKKDIPLQSENGTTVLQHELAHIRGHHSFDKLLLQLVMIPFWVNPFFWLIRRELHLIHEFIADQASVGDKDAAAFAEMILQSVYGTQYYSLSNPFFHKPIKRRLAMLQKTFSKPRNAYLGRVLALPLFGLLLFACGKRESQSIDSDTVVEKPIDNDNVAISDAVSELDSLKVNTNVIAEIASAEVNTKDSINFITITYKNGKQETLTKKEAIAKGLIGSPPPPPPAPSPGTLVIIDGVEKGTLQSMGTLDNMIKGEEIESMNVWTDRQAIEKWGQKGKDGVIEIITRKNKQNKSASSSTSMKPRQSSDIVHTEVDQSSHFTGGKAAWQTFLVKNLNPSVPVKNGAPTGSYTVQVQFKVAHDGTISDIKPITSFGYGMEEEVIELMRKSPKWTPAEINGYEVTTIHKQPVTFVIAEE